MIPGRVSSDGKEAVITLSVRGPTGRTVQFEAVIDTGFTNQLTLRENQIADLKLPWRGTAAATLADNRPTTADVYKAVVMWDGKSMPIVVAAVDTKPLVGMELMRGYRLMLDITPDGELQLDQISPER